MSADAYRHCEALTRRAAGNFYYGIRLLPADKRRAMCAVYSFARRVDDIGDGPLAEDDKRRLLDACSRSLSELSGARADPVLVALADAQTRFSLPLGALEGLLAGVRMDIDGARYESFEDLLVYCRRVAGTIGRLCATIFDARERQRVVALADDLGVAMQLTNILRDVSEDTARGRVYVPGEDLRRYGLSEDGSFLGADGQMDAMMRYQARRADEWFVRGLALVPLLDRRSGACVLAMTSIYRGVLERIVADPQAARQVRVSLPAWHKGWLATRSVATAALR